MPDKLIFEYLSRLAQIAPDLVEKTTMIGKQTVAIYRVKTENDRLLINETKPVFPKTEDDRHPLSDFQRAALTGILLEAGLKKDWVMMFRRFDTGRYKIRTGSNQFHDQPTMHGITSESLVAALLSEFVNRLEQSQSPTEPTEPTEQAEPTDRDANADGTGY